jgi:hypothetical protein
LITVTSPSLLAEDSCGRNITRMDGIAEVLTSQAMVSGLDDW